MRARILIIEDDRELRSNLIELLDEEGFEVVAAQDGAAGIALARARSPDLIVCDITLPVLDGYAVLRAVRDDPTLSSKPFIFLTAKAERAEVRAGMTLGADDYISKPFANRELLDAIRTRLRRTGEVLERARAALEAESREVSAAAEPAFVPADGVVVLDLAMRELYAQVARAAGSQINVLFLGENGVGKEILARAIHNLSPRAQGPFVAINCAALNESLVEAELFGHEKGVFTGALQARPGLLETAAGGTLFLDEVGELPASIQAKLLRALEDRKVLRLGARAEREVDVRFVAATNRDLEAEVERGRFRQDLFFRLNGISFTIPPLRERPSEIGALARIFLTRASSEIGRSKPIELSKEALLALESYAWPGNVRELRNAIERAVVLCPGDVLRVEHLPPKVGASDRPSKAPSLVPSSHPPLSPAPSSPAPGKGAVDDALSRAQREVATIRRAQIYDALEQTGGNRGKAAELLGVSRRTLVNWMRDYEVRWPRER